MSETPADVDFDVIAYDEQMGVLFGWQGCPEAERVDQLPAEGLARMAIAQAHLIRRRDGYVLKDRSGGSLGMPGEALPDDGVPRLERVDLIPDAESVGPVD